MWEKLTPDDIARVKRKLSLTRAATLSRHAAELKSLDAERGGIEELERLIAAFAEKYTTSGASALQPTTQSEEQPTEAIALEEHAPPAATPEAQQDAPSPGLRVHQQVSPNFGIPLRRAVGH
jgi:hypothetical protein